MLYSAYLEEIYIRSTYEGAHVKLARWASIAVVGGILDDFVVPLGIPPRLSRRVPKC